MDRFSKIILAFGAVGLLLLVTTIAFPALDLSFPLLIFAIVGFLLIPTYIIAKLTKHDTFYVITVAKTKKPLGFIKWISKAGIWDLLADLGLILGFGAIAVDYKYGRKKGLDKRIAIDLASALVLFAIFFTTAWVFFASKNPALFDIVLLWSIGFALGGLMLFAIVSLAWQALDIILKLLAGKMPCPGIAPVIPGLQIPNVPTFLTPPIYVWGAFLIILVVHEFSHGALMKRAKLKIKSTGILLLGLLPVGAFVEPDEKLLKKSSEKNQLRVYAIGPASNIYSMIVFFAIITIVSAAFTPVLGPQIDAMEKDIELESVTIEEVLEDYDLCGNEFDVPAHGVIEEGWILRKHNGIELKTVYDFKQAFSKADKNVSMVFETQTGKIVEKNIVKNQRGEIGIRTSLNYVQGKEPTQEYISLVSMLSGLSIFFGWLLMLSFAIAMINFLPMEPFDGGKMAKIVFLPYFGFLKMGKADTEKFIGRAMLWIILGLLLLNALPLFL